MNEFGMKDKLASTKKLFGAAATLAKKKAALATLNNVTLPKIYYSIGKRLAGLAQLPPELSSLREKIRSLEAQIASAPAKDLGEAASGFAAKAKQLAQQAAKATSDAAATAQIHAAYVSLGKAAVEKYGDKSVPKEVLPDLLAARATASTLASEIEAVNLSANQGWLSPARLLAASGVVGALLLGGLIIRYVTNGSAGTQRSDNVVASRKAESSAKPSAASEPVGDLPPGWVKPDPGGDAVKSLLGETSVAFVGTEYRGITLGASYSDVAKQAPIAVTQRRGPAVYCNDSGGAFVFTQEGKLVCHQQTYIGGQEDYLDKLKDVFGTTEKPILTREYSDNSSAVKHTFIRYTFPETLVLLEFNKGIALTAGRARQNEATHVYVIDRPWAEGLLRRSAEAKRIGFDWMKRAAAQVQAGAINPKTLPTIPHTRAKSIRDGAGVIYIDEKKEKTLEQEGYGGDALEQAATVARCTAHEPGKPGIVAFNCERYTGSEVAVFLKQETPEGSGKSGPVRALSATPFLNFLDTELKAIQLAQSFPPRTDEIRFVQRERIGGTVGKGWYEWNYSPDGDRTWKVKSPVSEGMEMEYLGNRGL